MKTKSPRSFPMLIAYWFIIKLFVYNNNKRMNMIPDIYSGIVQITWYYITLQCIRHEALQITWYYQVPWANPVPE